MSMDIIKLADHRIEEVSGLLPVDWWLLSDTIRTTSNKKERNVYILNHKTMLGMDRRFVERDDVLVVEGGKVGVVSDNIKHLIDGK